MRRTVFFYYGNNYKSYLLRSTLKPCMELKEQEQGAINLQTAATPLVACCKRRAQLSHCGSSAKTLTCMLSSVSPFNYCVNAHINTLQAITTRARVSSGLADTCSSAYHLVEESDFARRSRNRLLRHLATKEAAAVGKILALE